ncbi:MAG: thioredoxin family protein [Bosea sp. (in: a-proteobacteria)]|uniref:thioredoxin family protein n=1 Tax=Bosea sp. (in: a-proteobacteria) TaxID=1871050 RepID=UPI0027328415|nr:thioredoxin family protein [Bosea sp. (in: a-proteobacteria)]MDP3255154.1 thioredoxin family protein [Bosea sp. (in: a-proteobacteria)]MDP3318618.1 thioredoxin family protein [Bosea sp. (in: a-proteobacteria)]
MIDRRHALAALTAAALTVSALPALALDKTAFSQAAFDAAMKAGKPVLIDVSAPWCPTCKAQAPILSELAKQPRFKNLVVFNLDFDSQKDALRSLKALQQSTLIVFKGGTEMGRSVGDTNKASIEALLARAI